MEISKNIRIIYEHRRVNNVFFENLNYSLYVKKIYIYNVMQKNDPKKIKNINKIMYFDKKMATPIRDNQFLLLWAYQIGLFKTHIRAK